MEDRARHTIPCVIEFRPYRGSPDLVGMAAVINAYYESEDIDELATPERLAQQYEHLTNCDPETDIVIAEAGGEIVGYARTTWDDPIEGYRAYWVIHEAHPLSPGLADRLHSWAEKRAREVAARHDVDDRRFTSWTKENSAKSKLLAKDGYAASRFGVEMVRGLDDIPQRPLPDGIEIRPVVEDQWRALWEADVEAFRHHRGFSEPTEEDYAGWLADPNWDPDIWVVAWDEEGVAGQVRNFIDAAENQKMDRLRGYTEFISTARRWRKRGVASALIARSLQVLKDRGMTEAALGVDTDNLSGAHRLYESLGYARGEVWGFYEKQFRID